MAEIMITVKDNPYDYFTEFNEWNQWDQANGYHTLSYLGRVIMSSSELSEADQDQAEEDAINDILREDILDIYTVVVGPETEADNEVTA